MQKKTTIEVVKVSVPIAQGSDTRLTGKKESMLPANVVIAMAEKTVQSKTAAVTRPKRTATAMHSAAISR